MVQFRFPAEKFDDKDWTTVELTFDLITWALADEQRVAVVTDVQITQIRPSHSYVGKQNQEIFLEGRDIYDQTIQDGDIWDTALFNQLSCSYVSQIEPEVPDWSPSEYFKDPQLWYRNETAYFINRTLVGCPLPYFTQAQTVQVYLTFDGGYFFSREAIDLQIIKAPVIACLESILRPWIPASSEDEP